MELKDFFEETENGLMFKRGKGLLDLEKYINKVIDESLKEEYKHIDIFLGNIFEKYRDEGWQLRYTNQWGILTFKDTPKTITDMGGRMFSEDMKFNQARR